MIERTQYAFLKNNMHTYFLHLYIIKQIVELTCESLYTHAVKCNVKLNFYSTNYLLLLFKDEDFMKSYLKQFILNFKRLN